MRKIIITALALILCCCLCGCAENNEAPSSPASDGEELTSQSVQTSEREISAADPAEKLNEYLVRYGAETYWRDAYIEFKYFILGKSEIVCLLAVTGAEQVTSIPLGSVARAEQVKTGELTVVTVYDKSGGSVYICLAPAEAAELAERIGN